MSLLALLVLVLLVVMFCIIVYECWSFSNTVVGRRRWVWRVASLPLALVVTGTLFLAFLWAHDQELKRPNYVECQRVQAGC